MGPYEYTIVLTRRKLEEEKGRVGGERVGGEIQEGLCKDEQKRRGEKTNVMLANISPVTRFYA